MPCCGLQAVSTRWFSWRSSTTGPRCWERSTDPVSWAPSRELSGGVAQVQGTVQRATFDIRERLQERGNDGSDIPGAFSYLLRPRSYLIIGSLKQLLGERGGLNTDKYQSFELYRRHTQEPETVTFDELLARAEGLLEVSNV